MSAYIEGLKKAAEIVNNEMNIAKGINQVMALGMSQVLMLIKDEIKNKSRELYRVNNDETSEEKQKRLNCGGMGVNDWSCYRDCAFWDGKRCTNYE